MKIDIYKRLALLDHGQLADLVTNAKIIELIDELQKGRGEAISRGKMIADALGGAQAILLDKIKRGNFFLSISQDDEQTLKNYLEVDNIYSLRLTKHCRKKLFRFFGVEDTEENTSTVTQEAVGAIGVQYGLFEHQSIALLQSLTLLNKKPKRVMLHMPTGAGKTRTAMHVVSRHLNTLQSGIVVWLVHGIELCSQASLEFQRAWQLLGERPLPVVEMWGGRRGANKDKIEKAFLDSGREMDFDNFYNEIWPLNLKDAFVAASVDTMNNLLDSWEPGELKERTSRVTLIVFDEAHQATATTYTRAIERLGSNAGLLGLSATPGRRHHGGDTDADNPLVKLFGGNKVEMRFPGYSSPIEALVAQGYLARLEKEELNIVNSNLSAQDIVSVRNNLSSALDVDDKFMRLVGFDAIRNLQIVERIQSLVRDEGHNRVIVFAPSVESSNLLANLLRSIDIHSQSITSKTRSSNREEYISSYLADTPSASVLCNYGVLTTGFDAPRTSAVVIGRPTTSIVLLNQMAGRCIRGPRVGGNLTAKLVTVIDTSIPELVETVNQFHAFDDSWRTH